MNSFIISCIKYFTLPLVLSLIFVPICKRIGFALNIYSLENNRTVHSGKIVRIGGLAIFMSFLLAMSMVMDSDKTFLAIILGGCVVFLGGILDDMYNISPLLKVIFQSIGAIIAIGYGDVSLDVITISFLTFDTSAISLFISFIWIVGVSNAINLIDGLDGLSGGISFIVLSVIAFIGFLEGRTDITIIAGILAFSILGFLPYNFNPASIFIGDCGALFIGYMIACISLIGFKTSTFITLGFPIIILFVPLADTSLAIIRRKLKGQKISEADRDHLHHVLMIKMGLGHKKTVIVLYIVTILFGVAAILSYIHQIAGLILLIILSIVAWIFIELTGMINPKFHPIIGALRRTIKHPKKNKDAFFEANRFH